MPRSSFGRYAYAIGSNARAAKLAGVPVARWRLSFYAVCGGLAAVGGLIAVSRTGVGQPSANLGAELDVITAVILGGTSLKGGRGRLAGTLLGLLLIGVLNNGLILLSVEAYWQQVVKGGDPAHRGVLRRAAPGPPGGDVTATASGSSAAAGGRRAPTCRPSPPIPMP